ncbi:MAG: DUF2282 domain-containing protein [Nitrospinae bacterium]|jgi:uncharacterized membrane protein|nr:DUF2282 domain-containing protein [Nitrospinota bacterium]MDA1110832.1 DUF2282 domain-containing protein [Nitrospinota bacterium]
MKKNIALRSAVAGVVALGFLVAGTPSMAGDKHEKMKMEGEHCYGIAKAGMNDCKSGIHGCKGKAKADGEKDSFLVVPHGTFAKIVGGSTKAG